MNDRAPQAVPAQLTESKGTNLARELFTSNLWMSGLAMLKYIPRSFGVKQVDGMAFFTESKHGEFRNRALRITPANPRQWGLATNFHFEHGFGCSRKADADVGHPVDEIR